MHISDGVLPTAVLAGGYVLGGVLCAWSAVKMRDDEIPRTAVFTAAFFLASLIHFKFAITSVHLLMNGLVGIVLGKRCCLAISVGLFLQAVLFGHGGLSVLGVNICIFSLPALFVWQLFERIKHINPFLTGGLCGALAVIFSGVLFMLTLLTVGESFQTLANLALVAHIPVMIIEGIVTGFTVDFLSRVQPVLLRKEASS